MEVRGYLLLEVGVGVCGLGAGGHRLVGAVVPGGVRLVHGRPRLRVVRDQHHACLTHTHDAQFLTLLTTRQYK